MATDQVTHEDYSPDSWKILVVDTEKSVHEQTRDDLESLKFQGRVVEILDAFSPSEALEILEKEGNVAVALIDATVEDRFQSGLQLVQAIRHDLQDRLLRIILRTGSKESFPREQVLVDYDINDFKDRDKLDPGKLRAAVITAFRSYRDLSTITMLNHSLEKKVRERTEALTEANVKLRSYISRLENDHAAGGRMQQKLLPETQKNFGNAVFSSRVYSSMYLSGDFLDYFEIDENQVGFYVADVSGHGISSAFITVLLKNFIDTQLENYWNEGDPVVMKPYLLMKKLNGELLRENFGKYLTIFYGVLDRKENTLRYSNCGQFPHPLLRDQGFIQALSSSGTPVGLFYEPEFLQEEIEVGPEASLLIISDGILELLHNGSIKEKRNFIHTVFEQEGNNLQEITEKLGMSRQYSFPDDVTFLLFTRSAAHG